MNVATKGVTESRSLFISVYDLVSPWSADSFLRSRSVTCSDVKTHMFSSERGQSSDNCELLYPPGPTWLMAWIQAEQSPYLCSRMSTKSTYAQHLVHLTAEEGALARQWDPVFSVAVRGHSPCNLHHPNHLRNSHSIPDSGLLFFTA